MELTADMVIASPQDFYITTDDDDWDPRTGGTLYLSFSPSAVVDYSYQDLPLLHSNTANGIVVVRAAGIASTNTSKPSVLSVSPSGVDAPVSGNIVIRFNESMDNTVQGTVSLSGGTASIGASGSWSQTVVANDTYTIGYSGLAYNTAYTVNISGFKDAVSMEMDPVTTGYTFTTVLAPTYALTVTDGTDNTNTGPYAAGVQVSITANAAPAGQVFDSWTGGDDSIFASGSRTDATTTITMPASAVTVTATYRSASTQTAPTQITPLAATVAAGGSTTLTADGSPAPSFSLSGAPADVTISSTGTLRVASTVAAGTYTFDVTATNSEGSVTQTITLTVTAKSSDGDSSGEFTPIENIRSYEQAIVIKCREWANVRSGPSTDTEIVGRVYLGESISLLEWNKDETWCKILYDGDSKLGWLYYKFIKPVK